MKKTLIFIGFIFLSSLIFSQSKNDPTILTIGNHQFTVGEFWHIYNKNKDLSSFTETPEQFAERFTNYKLKVVDAINHKLETDDDFVTEFSKYAEELSASYLIDSVAIEQAARAAHHNMTRMVSAAHILVQLPRNQPATPADTLAAWTKINEARQKAVAGEDFNKLAIEYSEDPSVAQNGGELGYFSAFQMVYPFEKTAFSTPVGQISEIVRSQFGYHIIKVNDLKQNPGKIRVAHIMKQFQRNAPPEAEAQLKNSIDSIYRVLQSGGDFAELAKEFSDDKQSATRGGEMQPLLLGQIPVFTDEAFKLSKDGEVSAPVKTPYGWHIIKRLELLPIEDYQTSRPQIITNMARDERGQAGNTAFIKTKRYSSAFKVNKPVFDEITALSNDTKTNEEFFGKISQTDSRKLYEYEKENVTVSQFLEYLKNDNTFMVSEGIVSVEKAMDRMASEEIMKIEKNNLPKKIPTYQYLSNEYYDGLLIFEISNKRIWSQVGADTVALYEHYLNFASDYTENGELIPYENCKGDVMNSYQSKMEADWMIEMRKKYNPVFNYKLLKNKKYRNN
ncbi:MAG: peptidylprolyl isomerase [Marinilabiliaceae bacterium]|nr:peptidylprolyl isomerase [Marinilabiliaceae bacterium]